MFMLYSIVIGVALGLLLGGRVTRLADLRLEWITFAVVAIAIQTALFTEVIWTAAGGLAPPIYVASTGVVLAVVVRNVRRLPALVIVSAGTVSNLVAIISNGGYMPVTAEALGIAAPTSPRFGGNSVLTPDPAFPLLVDRFTLPEWLPLATVFSVGDVLIGIGLVLALVVAMREPSRGEDATSSRSAPLTTRSTTSGGAPTS